MDIENENSYTEDESTIKERQKNKQCMKNKKSIILRMVICIIECVAIVLQIGYVFINQKYGFEYIYDFMKYVINEIIILLGCYITCMNIKTDAKSIIKKYIKVIVISLISILTVVNAILLINNCVKTQTIVKISNDLSSTVIFKKDLKTGKCTIYKNLFLWMFARTREEFKEEAIGNMKFQWLTNDVCVITYLNKKSELCEYVYTAGDRGSGSSYYYVINAILGDWVSTTLSDKLYTISVEDGKIKVSINGNTYEYSYNDITQYGTLAITMNSESNPNYVIALNENCSIDNKTNLVRKGGTITIYEISMNDKEKAYELECTTFKEDSEENNSNIDSKYEGGKKLQEDMQKIIESDPTLENFSSAQGMVKITNTLDNIFFVARLGMEEDYKQYAINGCNSDVQINKIEMLAGNEDECLVKIYTKERIASVSGDTMQETSSETAEYEWLYRIKKAEKGSYLVVKCTYLIDATVGLEKLSEEKVIETKQNEEYHFYIKAEF